MESIYFFFSFGLLLGRTVAVCLFAARVHDEGQRPLRYMYSIPSSIYNEEVCVTFASAPTKFHS